MAHNSVVSNVAATASAGRKGRLQRPEVCPDIGDIVAFSTNTGQPATGYVVQKIVEKRQETILLIERTDDQWRAFRLARDVSLISKTLTPVREPVVIFPSPD